MDENSIKRLPRLTAILTLLQSKKIVTANELAKKFDVSTRTIYRDIKALESSGIPVTVEEGRGYSIMDGYRIPPVMFTESEVNALLTIELIAKASKDESLIREYSTAMEKIRSVMPSRLKSAMQNLEDKLAITKFYTAQSPKSRWLMHIQKALLQNIVLKINYTTADSVETVREIEPFAIYSNSREDWVVIAYCRMRADFRSFSLSGISQINFTDENFIPQSISFEKFYKKNMAPG